MKMNDKLLKALNSLLAAKLTTINQFMVHSEMCDNLGYRNLHKAIQKMAMEQMLLAEWLIERISFFEGSSTALPSVNAILIEKSIAELISKHNMEKQAAFHAYTEAIELARNAEDHHTADLLNSILQKEKGRHDWAEIQREQIKQKGLENYLITQTEYMAN